MIHRIMLLNFPYAELLLCPRLSRGSVDYVAELPLKDVDNEIPKTVD